MDTNGRLHGHSYLVECWTLDACCLVELECDLRRIAGLADHTVLEDSIGSPSMEAMGEWFLAQSPALYRVVIRRPTLGYVVEVCNDKDES